MASSFEPSLSVWLVAAADSLELGVEISESRRVQLVRALREAAGEVSFFDMLRESPWFGS